MSFQVDDAAIQVYKNGDYGTYLDLESSLDEQSEEIEGLNAKWVKVDVCKFVTDIFITFTVERIRWWFEPN